MNIENIVKEYGTPFYLYNIDELINRVNYLKDKINPFKLVYAIKANTFIVKEIDELIDKYEICSKGEFDICNKLNINHKKMVISGVNKDKDFLDNIISNYDIGRYTIESIRHYEYLSELSEKYNKKINVLIRLTSGNQFGVSEEDFKYIIENYNNNFINICGIEYFSGTQKSSIKKIQKEINYLNEFISIIKDEYNLVLDEVEYGPGLAVSYYQGDEFDEEQYFKELKDLLNTINSKNILIESGRSVVANMGYYVTSVVDLKSNKNGNFAIVDGGINHLVYYGSTLSMKTPYYDLISNGKEKENYNIFGSLCTTNDVLLKNININKLSIGDIFIFKKVGAYSSTEGISLLLSRDLPKIIIYKNDKSLLVRDTISTSDINFPVYKKGE